MATIVEYSAEKSAKNWYPKKIVSPSSSSECCVTHMKRIGEMHGEGNGRHFYYKRCTHCGFTVRECVVDFQLEALRALELAEWKRRSDWIDPRRRAVGTDLAA